MDEGVGWCDQTYVGIRLHPVARPTKEQIRYVQSIPAHAEQNFLEIRYLLQQGNQVVLGIMLPEHAEKLSGRLRELGFSFSIVNVRAYRPL